MAQNTASMFSSSPIPTNPISGQLTFQDLRTLLTMGGLANAITACGVIFSCFAILFAGLRMLVRRVQKTLGWDDYLLVVAAFLFCVDNVMAIIACLFGIGVDNFTIDWARPQLGTKWAIIWGLVYTISIIPLQLSLCWSIFRINKTASMRLATNLLVGLTILGAVIQIFMVAFACGPVSHLWDQVTQGDTCMLIGKLVVPIYLFASICVFVDWIVSAMVFEVIRTTEMSRARKLLSWGVFGTGVCASFVTIIRVFFVRAFVGVGSQYPSLYYDLGGILLTSQFEVGLAIIGSCASLAPQAFELINWRFWDKITGKWLLLKPTKVDDIEAARNVAVRNTAVYNAAALDPAPRDTSKTLGTSTIITGGLTAAEKKARKRKSKQRKKKACTICGIRNCKDHDGMLDPLLPPEGTILVTETVEVTYSSAEPGEYSYDDSLDPFGNFSNRTNVSITTGANPVTSSSCAPRHRRLETITENAIALDMLTADGCLQSLDDTTRVNSVTSEDFPANTGRPQGFRDV